MYSMTFDPVPPGSGFPPIVEGFHGFWSVTLYTPTYNLLQGSKNYTINSYDPDFHRRTDDGGLRIIINPTDPGTMADGWYWLQSPPPGSNTSDGSDFFLILRVYVPGPTVSGSQTWPPPPIEVWQP